MCNCLLNNLVNAINNLFGTGNNGCGCGCGNNNGCGCGNNCCRNNSFDDYYMQQYALGPYSNSCGCGCGN